MSRIKVTNLRQDSAASDNISLDSSGNVAFQAGSASAPSLHFTGDTNTGIYAPAADSVAVVTGGSARTKVDSSGRLLVGTSAISSPKCDASGIDLSNGNLTVVGGADSTLLTRTDSTRKDMRIGCVHYTNAEEPVIGLNFVVDSSNNAVMYGGGTGLGNAATQLQFYTAANQTTTTGTERMRILSNGAVVMTADTSFTQHESAQLTVRNDSNYTIACKRTGTGGEGQIAFKNGNGLVGSISTSGSATAYNTSSDYRLKENVVDLDDAIDRVKQLAPKRFNFIADDTETLVDGFLAHEAQAVVPEAVTGTHNEVDDEGNPVYQGIDQSKLVPLLTAALQEAVGKIETLEAANTSQAATIAALDARLTALEG